MRPFGAVVIYLGVVLASGALLAPWGYWGAQALAGLGAPLTELGQVPFHRFLNRALLLAALVGLWPLLRALGFSVRSAVRIDWGRRGWWPILRGFSIGFASLGCLVCLVVLMEGRSWDWQRTDAQIIRHLMNAGSAAVAVGLIEEILFRGGLFGGLRKQWRFWPAVVVSSSVYGVAHFLEKPPAPESVEWWTGFVLFGQMWGGLAESSAGLRFFNLVLVGCILGRAYERSGSLNFSIGLHAGWVFWLKTFGFITSENATAVNSIWGSRRLIDGWAATVVLFLVLKVVHWRALRLGRAEAAPEPRVTRDKPPRRGIIHGESELENVA